MNKPTAMLSTEVQATLEAQVAKAIQPATATESPAAQSRPGIIEINELTHVALAAAAHLCRLGYVPYPGLAPQIYANTGFATIALCLGSPDSHAVKVAEAAVAQAEAVQQRDYEKEVAEAAAKLVEKAAYDAKQAELAKQIEEQRKALRKLEAQLA
jgi:hypothetical protein